jgi:hypothetical protein
MNRCVASSTIAVKMILVAITVTDSMTYVLAAAHSWCISSSAVRQ